MAFKVGDLVRLKSGGPVMTVKSVGPNSDLRCQWFNQDGEVYTLVRENFPPDTVQAHDSSIKISFVNSDEQS